MDLQRGLAIFMILWGLATTSLGLFKVPFLWNIGKIQGFVQLIGETGTRIFTSILGLAALIGGVLLL
jgi:hypothetical protein